MSLLTHAYPIRALARGVDVVAGAGILCFAYGHRPAAADVMALVLAAACIDGAGAILAFESKRRDDGRLALHSAITVGGTLLVGLVLAMSRGWASLLVASVLCGVVLLRATVTDRVEVAGPVIRGLQRGVGLMLGMTAAPWCMMVLDSGRALAAAALVAAATAAAWTPVPGRHGAARALLLFSSTVACAAALAVMLAFPVARSLRFIRADLWSDAWARLAIPLEMSVAVSIYVLVMGGMAARAACSGRSRDLSACAAASLPAMVLLEMGLVAAHGAHLPWSIRVQVLGPMALFLVPAVWAAWREQDSCASALPPGVKAPA